MKRLLLGLSLCASFLCLSVRARSSHIPLFQSPPLGRFRSLSAKRRLVSPTSPKETALREDKRTTLSAVDPGVLLYQLQQGAGDLVTQQLTHVTPLSFALLFGTGLITALSPCSAALLPLTIAYLSGGRKGKGRRRRRRASADGQLSSTEVLSEGGATSVDGEETAPGVGVMKLPDAEEEEEADLPLPLAASLFALGLCFSLSSLGLLASLAGAGIFGQLRIEVLLSPEVSTYIDVLPLLAALLAVGMGLNVLGLLDVSFPSIDLMPGKKESEKNMPKSLQAFAFGASSGLVSTPCSTPVLAAVLAFVAKEQDPLLGAALLLAYTAGFSAPVIAAGVASSSVLEAVTKGSSKLQWITPLTGSALVSYGTYAGLSAILGPPV
mmetsp:Transcript_17704/g.35953  ORF Transcript_17704/g.35953 Transcript_17704/m.35953 type:complete len:381 (+) Transcript_17704:123-1265(+)